MEDTAPIRLPSIFHPLSSNPGDSMSQPVYCARCGTPMQRRLVDDRERDVCPVCGFILYRNPVPAVGVVVALEGQEETGLLVRVDHLLGVYSFGEGQSTGLLISYAATATGGELAAADDATEVGAFALDALPAPLAFPTHLQAIERWRREARAIESLHLPVEQSDMLWVRYAERSDTPAVLALLLGGAQPDDNRLVAAEALLHDRLTDPDRPTLVAEVDGLVGGVALLGFHQSLRGWYATLDDLVVGGELRRGGLGTALVEFSAALASARGCALIQVALPEVEAGTREFLAACGF